MRRKKIIVGVAISYLLSWGLTAAVGISQARRTHRESRYITEWSGYAPAPFVVRYDYRGFSSASEGTYLWGVATGWYLREKVKSTWYPVF